MSAMASGTTLTRRRFLRAGPAEEPQGPGITIAGTCLARRGVVCQSCGDACPERAIRFSLQRGGAPLPAVDETRCTGCGACLEVCPADAIAYRQARREHARDDAD